MLDQQPAPRQGKVGPPIIAVQFAEPRGRATTGELLDFYIWLGVEYTCHLAGDRPLVLNINFGLNAGSHDGEACWNAR